MTPQAAEMQCGCECKCEQVKRLLHKPGGSLKETVHSASESLAGTGAEQQC